MRPVQEGGEGKKRRIPEVVHSYMRHTGPPSLLCEACKNSTVRVTIFLSPTTRAGEADNRQGDSRPAHGPDPMGGSEANIRSRAGSMSVEGVRRMASDS